MNKRLFEANCNAVPNLRESRYGKEVVNELRKDPNYETENQEFAIVRKELKRILDMLSSYFGHDVASEDFKEWYNKSEEAKITAKNILGIF